MKTFRLCAYFCIVYAFVFIFGCDEFLQQDVLTDYSSGSSEESGQDVLTDHSSEFSEESGQDVLTDHSSESSEESGQDILTDHLSGSAQESGQDSDDSAQFMDTVIPANESLLKTPVDFSVSVYDLVCGETNDIDKGYIRPGKKLTLQARVHKDASVIAGGRVTFMLSGKTIDTVPFSMNGSDQYINVKCYTILPYNTGLNTSQNGLLRFEAIIDTDDLSSDINNANNSAGTDIAVVAPVITKNNPPADAVITWLKTTGDIGENIAIPGKPLTLNVSVSGGSGNTRVYFYVNDDLIGDQPCYISSSSGISSCSSIYYVPNNYSGFLNIRVILENGEQAAITVTVETYDFQLKSNSISWEYSGAGANAGNQINFRCNIYKDSDISFGYTEGLRMIFVVNGIQSDPIKAETNSIMSPYMGEVYYGYIIPENCSWPLQVKVFADTGGLYQETNEENNTAEISVSVPSPDNDSADLSISSEDMWFYPGELIPGKTVQFFAAVRNNSSRPVMSIRVCFYINGIQLDAGNDLYNGTIGGGQYHVFQEKWTVPYTLSDNLVYTLTIIPGNSMSGDGTGDNTASLTYQNEAVLPDFTVSRIKAYGTDYDTIFSGQRVDLVATVYNHGPVPALQVSVDLYIGGVVSRSCSVSLPAYGAAEIRQTVWIPKIEDQTPASPDITGFTGHVYPGLGSGSVNMYAAADPGNLFAESDETNNISGESVLNVATSYQKGAVYLRVRDEDENNIQDAGVSITAGGKTSSAITDSFGACSFNNVPFGAYTLSVTADNYNNAMYPNEYLYESNRSDYTFLYIDDNSYITGVVTYSGSPLEDVSVSLQDTDIKTKTNADGKYSLEIPPGTYNLKFIKAGYERKIESVTVPVISSVIKNATMSTTTYAYISGYIYGTEGEALSGMEVFAFRANDISYVNAVTDSEGFYSLAVPLYAAYTEDIGIRVTGRGLSKIQGLFLYQGLEHNGDLSFESIASGSGEILSSIEGRVAPWTECASMPGTFFNSDYEVSVIYGTFAINTYVMATDSVITYLNLDITPDFWYYDSVSSSWSPTDMLEINNEIAATALDVACLILPLNIPIEAGSHSSNYTKVWVKKVSIISDGTEVFQRYPDKVNDYDCSLEKAVNWDNCRIKYYLTTVSEGNSLNPAAGYGCDHVLIEWDPKEQEFTKIGYFTPAGWNEKEGHENFTDQG